ncbi:hypothetical protein OAS39_00680 [Pirellulales bacterium]|nr:hypothetical protein [Pirellulales bacterium]
MRGTNHEPGGHESVEQFAAQLRDPLPRRPRDLVADSLRLSQRFNMRLDRLSALLGDLAQSDRATLAVKVREDDAAAAAFVRDHASHFSAFQSGYLESSQLVRAR